MRAYEKTFSVSALALIVLLALAVRLPGIFWGVTGGNNLTHYHHDKTVTAPFGIILTTYHADEPNLAKWAMDFLARRTDPKIHYPKGQSLQIAVCSFLLRPWGPINGDKLILMGRAISLLYGTMTVLLVYFLAKELFSRDSAALLSALFLALSGLHVTQSHYATVDVGNSFWICATTFFSLLSIRRKSNFYLIAAMCSCGTGIAFKMPWILLVPILYALIKQKKSARYWLLALACILVSFVAATGGRYTYSNLLATIENVRRDNIGVIPGHNKLINPIMYLFGLVAGAGLPVFLLSLYGVGHFRNRLTSLRKMLGNEAFGTVVLPILLHFITVCFLDIPFPRHILPVIPLLTIAAGYGLMRMRRPLHCEKNRLRFACVILVIVAYQLIYVGATEYHFVFDTRESAGTWIRENIPQGTQIGGANWDFALLPTLGKDYKLGQFFGGPVIVFHETLYRRYLRSPCNPFKQYPATDEIFHGNPGATRAIQALFKGQLNVDLLAKFQVRCVTPEMMLYKHFWGTYPMFIGDVLIYGHRGWLKTHMPNYTYSP